jgi:hypothetical protein
MQFQKQECYTKTHLCFPGLHTKSDEVEFKMLNL